MFRQSARAGSRWPIRLRFAGVDQAF